MKKFVLIDSHALIHRAYHALPPLTSPAGEPVGAVYGFATIVLRILRELKPDYLAAAFDLPGPTFRHAAYERYKAQRPETPGDLASQFEKVREVLMAFGVPVFEKPGYEADDIIGTIAEKMKKQKGVETVIVTGDMDALQLVRPGICVYTMKKSISDTVIYDSAAVRERYGFGPERITDFKGLKGDPSDNIPGVKGIGEKTATELIAAFGGLEGIFAALKKNNKKISEGVREKLQAGEEDALFSRELATIRRDVPIDFDLAGVRRENEKDNTGLRAVFRAFGFVSLEKRLGADSAPQREQGTLLPLASLSSVRSAADRTEHMRSPEDFKKNMHRAGSGRTAVMVMDGRLLCVAERAGGVKVFITGASLLADSGVRAFFTGAKNLFTCDAKALVKFFRAHGIAAPDIGFDLMLAAYLCEGFSRDFSLSSIIAREAAGSAGGAEHFFAAADALEQKLAVGTLKKVFADIELPLAPVLADMEERGVLVDRASLAALGKQVDGKISGLTARIHALAGEKFNINSSQQLSVILFDRLGIKTHGLRKTEKGGVISTRESELEKLKNEHPIIPRVLDHRELRKLKTTYIDALPALIDKKTNRIHTTFNQIGASTGRLSSTSPNLQNIPILSETGREIRKAFVAPEGFFFASFDYSQIELRAAAHMAHDKKMVEAFRNGMDIHAMTAAEIYNVSADAVTPDLRRAAKTLNFGVLYGMGAGALAEATGMPREDAKKFISEYFRDFSGIRDYIAATKEFAREHGFVETLFGRRRWISEINSSNPRIRSEAERMAVNMPVQGTATGDIVKMAMIAAARLIKKEKWEPDARMTLQVHDELIFEIKKERIEKIAPKIKNIMEHVAKLSVPLVVDVKAGPSWGEQKKIL